MVCVYRMQLTVYVYNIIEPTTKRIKHVTIIYSVDVLNWSSISSNTSTFHSHIKHILQHVAFKQLHAMSLLNQVHITLTSGTHMLY